MSGSLQVYRLALEPFLVWQPQAGNGSFVIAGVKKPAQHPTWRTVVVAALRKIFETGDTPGAGATCPTLRLKKDPAIWEDQHSFAPPFLPMTRRAFEARAITASNLIALRYIRARATKAPFNMVLLSG